MIGDPPLPLRGGDRSGWGFSGASLGNLGDRVGDVPGDVSARRGRALGSLPAGVDHLVFSRQVHGTGVLEVTTGDLPRGGPGAVTLDAEADALVTGVPGVALGVVVADCVPVLLLDAGAGVVAAAHAGRRGADAGVVPAAVAQARRLGARDLRAVIGPSVCGRCYEVPAALHDDVAARHPAMSSTTRCATPALDVAAGVLSQLDRLGVPAQVPGGCTVEDRAWFSVRRDGAATGRGAGVVWTAPVPAP